MSRIANEHMEIVYQANREMEERYDETIEEIENLKTKFNEVANEINEDCNSWIDISNFETEEEIDCDNRYKELVETHKEIKELEEERDHLKKELVHAKVIYE